MINGGLVKIRPGMLVAPTMEEFTVSEPQEKVEQPSDDGRDLATLEKTIEDFCEIVYEEAEAEGIRAEVVFAQVCKETGYLQFGGDVSPEQCNFAGIGAVGGGAAGETFESVRKGIRAQVQHLKAYSTVEELNGECVDPRFEYVKRGTSPYVEWLGIQENPYGGGWAAAEGYGISLRDDYMYPMLGS